MRDSQYVHCRARVSPKCYDGMKVLSTYGPDVYMSEDGTFDPETVTVVCDPCYLRVMPHTPSGKALLHELPDAIATVKAAQR